MHTVVTTVIYASQIPPPEEGEIQLRPQPGPQDLFLSSDADIAIFGGAAGAGKTFSLLMCPLKHTWLSSFSAVIFRRTTTQIRNPGGLWDESCGLYAGFAHPISGPLEHHFQSGAKVKMAGLEYDADVYGWDGAQIPLIMFDQLEHFTKNQFFYMLGRNRSTCGVVPFIRATCNPDPDSWLAEFIAWWIDQDEKLPNGEPNPMYGFPIKERSGKVRWFIRGPDDSVIWRDSREEILKEFGDPNLPEDHHDQPDPKSVTFIPGTVYDNQKLLTKNRSYLANLKALNRVERERLLAGNWKIRAAAGLMFRREWCTMLDEMPPEGHVQWVRYWDLAATEKTESNNPDWTVGVKMGRYKRTKRYVIAHARRMRVTPAKVEAAILSEALQDGRGTRIGIPQDPGQAGKSQVANLVKLLAGFTTRAKRETGDKITRFGPFSAQAEAGNVDVVRGDWNGDFFRVLEGFPDGKFDDDADAAAGAFDMLAGVGWVDLSNLTDGLDGATAVESADSPWNIHR